MHLQPDVTIDCLYIASKLQKKNGSFTKVEVHLFAYLACLLWLYDKKSVSEWGYAFIGTELGAPYSIDVDKTLEELQRRGFVISVKNRLKITELAEQQLQVMPEFGGVQFSDRVNCLKAACSSMSAFSVGIIGTALSNEPELKRALSLPKARELLERSGIDQLYDQFDALRKGLHPDGDLRVPAVVWISALYRANAFEVSAA